MKVDIPAPHRLDRPRPSGSCCRQPGRDASDALIRSGRLPSLSAVQEGLIDPGVDVNAVAGRQVDEVLEACAVSRYLVRVVRLDRGEDALLGRGDLYLQLLKHVAHLLPCTGAGMARRVLERWPANAVLGGTMGVSVRMTFAHSGGC